MSGYDKVLLLGNGVNRCFNGSSWDEYLKKIAIDKNDKYLSDKYSIPMSFKPVLLTKDDVYNKINETKESLNIEVKDVEMKEMIKSILDIGFDDILTTNYGYELESVAMNVEKISDYQLTKHLLHNNQNNKADPSYNIYNHYCFNENNKNNIWHIHGEMRKTSSIILGQYYYGNLLSNIKERLQKRKSIYQTIQRENKQLFHTTWIDKFILGDVYILGFGLDFAEVDLWWLINRKQREKAKHGKIFFYDIRKESEIEDVNKNIVVDLLQIFIDNDVDKDGYKGEIVQRLCKDDSDYKRVYREVIEEINTKINK